jgi:hypothetical protein
MLKIIKIFGNYYLRMFTEENCPNWSMLMGAYGVVLKRTAPKSLPFYLW